MIDWIATWKAIADAWILQVSDEDPDWIGERMCSLVRCCDERELTLWAEEVGMKNVEQMIVRKKSCAGCRYYLGGGCCRIHEEAECREGGGYELWEEEE